MNDDYWSDVLKIGIGVSIGIGICITCFSLGLLLGPLFF